MREIAERERDRDKERKRERDRDRERDRKRERQRERREREREEEKEREGGRERGGKGVNMFQLHYIPAVTNFNSMKPVTLNSIFSLA